MTVPEPVEGHSMVPELKTDHFVSMHMRSMCDLPVCVLWLSQHRTLKRRRCTAAVLVHHNGRIGVVEVMQDVEQGDHHPRE